MSIAERIGHHEDIDGSEKDRALQILNTLKENEEIALNALIIPVNELRKQYEAEYLRVVGIKPRYHLSLLHDLEEFLNSDNPDAALDDVLDKFAR